MVTYMRSLNILLWYLKCNGLKSYEVIHKIEKSYCLYIYSTYPPSPRAHPHQHVPVHRGHASLHIQAQLPDGSSCLVVGHVVRDVRHDGQAVKGGPRCVHRGFQGGTHLARGVQPLVPPAVADDQGVAVEGHGVRFDDIQHNDAGTHLRSSDAPSNPSCQPYQLRGSRGGCVVCLSSDAGVVHHCHSTVVLVLRAKQQPPQQLKSTG
jgi:hypothetical protein